MTISSSWLKKILIFDFLKRLRIGLILLLLCPDYFHHGWRKFWKLLLPNVPEWLNSIIFVSRLFSPRLKKFLKIAFLKRPRMAQFYYFCVVIIFTMIEELKNCLSQTSQNDSILLFLIIFAMFEETFENCFSQTSQNGSILLFLCHDYFHHGWRKFWILTFSNVPEWLNSTTFLP